MFVETAQLNATKALENLVDTYLIDLFDTATTYFHAGILTAQGRLVLLPKGPFENVM